MTESVTNGLVFGPTAGRNARGGEPVPEPPIPEEPEGDGGPPGRVDPSPAVQKPRKRPKGVVILLVVIGLYAVAMAGFSLRHLFFSEKSNPTDVVASYGLGPAEAERDGPAIEPEPPDALTAAARTAPKATVPPEPDPELVKVAAAVADLSTTVDGLKAALAETRSRDAGRLDALEATLGEVVTRLGKLEQGHSPTPPSSTAPDHDTRPSTDHPDRSQRLGAREAAKPLARNCRLHGATDGAFGDGRGTAWIATDGGEPEEVRVGQRHRCLGTVKRIAPDGNGWVVVGSERSLRMGG